MQLTSVVLNVSQWKVVNDTTITFNGLKSGSKYNFTVTTVTEDYTRAESVKVFYYTSKCIVACKSMLQMTCANMFGFFSPKTKQFIVLFSGPYNITDLNAFTLNTTAVYLNWTKPYEYKVDFKYRVKTTGCHNQTTNSEAENMTFSDLISGTNCSFCVTVIAENGTEGKEICTTQYTSRALLSSLIFSLTCISVELFTFFMAVHQQNPMWHCSISPMRDSMIQSWYHGPTLLEMWRNMNFI